MKKDVWKPVCPFCGHQLKSIKDLLGTRLYCSHCGYTSGHY